VESGLNSSIFKKSEGVFISTTALEKFAPFENAYLNIREKEKRILSISEIKQLPYPEKTSVDYELWKIRGKNITRFLNHLSKRERGLKILDIGCGNGFFTNLMTEKKNKVFGVDVNLTELKQAALAFTNPDIHWYYADILNDTLPEQKFDLITFCTSFHYFENPQLLLKTCFSLLKKNGEIHIIDSPFYDEEGRKTARLNSVKHFEKMGVTDMKNYYYHNSYKALEGFHYKTLYHPKNFLRKLLRIKDSPFPWIVLKK
jgi:ubiquinone/menaquinone biosynthesis C-methylase UbiE